MSSASTATGGFAPGGHTFLVTGGAGFIGSHIARRLVGEGARVLDQFVTGRRANLHAVIDRIELIEGDIRDAALVRRAMDDVEYVLHLAALVSVPESIDCPELNFDVNFAGTHNVLLAARDAGVKHLVFSSSCAVYGDQPPPHHEALAPRSLSPYAAAKLSGEQLIRSYTYVYGLPTVCLRYFNVFGPYQNPRGGYAAAIPLFITALLKGRAPRIFGDGQQSRDFVYVANVVDANLLACGVEAAVGGVFNIGTGGVTSLLDLLQSRREISGGQGEPEFGPPRAGDIRFSYGDISRAREALGYRPAVDLHEGLRRTFEWYRANAGSM